MDKVYSIVRKTYDRGLTDEMEDLDGNPAIWRIVHEYHSSISSSSWSDYDQNLRFVKNHFWSSLKKSSKTLKNDQSQKETTGVTMIEYKDYTWSATSLLWDRVHQISNAKTNVFADSVLCLGGFKENPNEVWENRWSSSGTYSQDSQHLTSSRRFKNS